MGSTPEKTCKRCGESWPLTPEFYHRLVQAGKKRWHSWCRACMAEYLRDRYQQRKKA